MTSADRPIEQPTPSNGRRWRRPALWAAATAAIISVSLLLAVDIYPMITNDSLAYLSHSNDIGGLGFVQLGYRQVGYPAFLALVDAVATPLRMEPLLLTAALQRFVYLTALGFSVWLWRWRAAPLVLFGIIPSLVVYTNFILTEGIGIGLALWYAVLTAWVLRLGAIPDGDTREGQHDTQLIVAGLSVGVIFVVLTVIRFQFILMVFGLIAALYVMHRVGRQVRTAAYLTAAGVVLLLSSFLVLTAAENAGEFGVFFPSVRGERSQFWAVWQVAFSLSPENRSNGDLVDLYASGSANNFVNTVERLPSYAEQRVEFETAMDRLIVGTGTSWGQERTDAFLGVLRGGRIDDIGWTVLRASRSDFRTVNDFIYRATPIQTYGINSFIDEYNDGRRIEPVLVSPLAPWRTVPYFATAYSWLLVAALVVLLAGLWIPESRLLAVVGAASLLVTAAVFGYYLMDNIRFLLVPLMFVLGVSTGVADSMWRQLRSGRAKLAHPS